MVQQLFRRIWLAEVGSRPRVSSAGSFRRSSGAGVAILSALEGVSESNEIRYQCGTGSSAISALPPSCVS
eukprot:243146-Lingulodinium_polyedra.AAC.1